MLWITLFSLLLYLSLATSVLKYFKYRTQAFHFAVMALFASLWGLGSLIVTYSPDSDITNLGLVLFIYPPAVSSYFLVEYLSAFNQGTSNKFRTLNTLLFPLQLLMATWFITGEYVIVEDLIKGSRYLLYTSYYLVVFTYSFAVYLKIRRNNYISDTSRVNTLALMIFVLANIITNILLPSLGITSLVWAGPLAGSIPLATHILTIHRHGILGLSYSFTRFYYTEVIHHLALFGAIVTVLILTHTEGSAYYLALAATVGTFLLSMASILYKVTASKLNYKFDIEWGRDVRNLVSYSVAKIDEVNTIRDLSEASERILRKAEIECLEVTFDQASTPSRGRYVTGARVLLEDGDSIVGSVVIGQTIEELSRDQITFLELITELVVLKKRTFKLMDEYDQSVTDLVHELDTATVGFHQKQTVKDEFISLASHQLRTPLSVIALNNKLLISGYQGVLDTDQQALLEESQSNVDRMAAIIDELLESARIDEGFFRVKKDKYDIKQVILKLAAQYERLTLQKRVKVQIVGELENPEVNLDAVKITEAISAILDNAIKYSHGDSVIKITMSANEATVKIKIADEGIGIAPEDIERLFKKFGRTTDSKKMRPDGLGLGLYLAKKTVEAHGGDILVKSKLGEGSTFTIVLPRS